MKKIYLEQLANFFLVHGVTVVQEQSLFVLDLCLVVCALERLDFTLQFVDHLKRDDATGYYQLRGILPN